MVSTGMGDDAPLGNLLRQLHDRIACASKFERPDLLELLALEKQFPPRHLVQRLAGHHGRLVSMWGNPPHSGMHILKGSGVLGHRSYVSRSDLRLGEAASKPIIRDSLRSKHIRERDGYDKTKNQQIHPNNGAHK